jgi:signal transduction histidine kinase
LRGALSGSLLLLALLLAIVQGEGPQGRLAALAAAALVARGLLAAGWHRRALGEFAEPLDLAAGLALVLAGLAWTGGVASPLYVLLLLDIVLARGFSGASAARFLAAATLPGLAVVASLAPPAPGDSLAVGLRFLWPVALLAILELSGASAARGAGAAEGLPLAASPAFPEPPESREREAPLPAGAAAGLVHDLRSPLTVVRLYTDLLAERAREGEPPLEEHLRNIRSELELMESLLAAEAGDGRGQPRAMRVDLVKVLSRLAGSYRLAHSGRVRIEFVAEEPELPVTADGLALERAIRNVLDNAVKYTPPGGEVRIRAGAEGDRAFVVVSDTGTGMSASERERAFERSFRSDAARASGAPGRGLGLALSKELVERHGGRISLASDPGRGSDVRMLFPMAKVRR